MNFEFTCSSHPRPIRLAHEDGGTARPWLTVVMDDFSRAIAGYYLAFDPPSSLRTCLALRQAIWRKQDPHWQVCGIPDVLYTDNGSDFNFKRLEQVTTDLRFERSSPRQVHLVDEAVSSASSAQ